MLTIGLAVGQNDDSAQSEMEQEFELEYRRQLYRRAAELVRNRADETTWLAFSLTMIDGMKIADAARELGCNSGVVYAARSRMIRRLRDTVQMLSREGEEE